MSFIKELAELAEKKLVVEAPMAFGGTALDISSGGGEKKKPLTDFKLMRAAGIKDDEDINQKNAANLIAKAHEKAEEIETVAFGLELEDGEVVKVYVALDQAEAFETEMASLLGKVDDVEKAIDELAEKFDIVSVEWPAERKERAEQDAVAQPVPNTEEDDEEKVKLDFQLDKPEEEKPVDDDDDANQKETEEDEEEPTPDNGEEDEEEETTDENGKKVIKKKKKGDKKKVEAKKKEVAKVPPDLGESYNPGARIKARFLTEDDVVITKEKPNNKDDNKKTKEITPPEVVKLEDIFRSHFQQKIIQVVLLLGFPVDRLLMRKNSVKTGIRNTANKMASNSSAKLMVNKLLHELTLETSPIDMADKIKSYVGNHTDEDLKESSVPTGGESVINNILDLMLDVIKKLGIPDEIISSRVPALRQELRPIAMKFSKHARIRNYLQGFVDAIENKKTKEDDINEEVDMGADKYLQMISKILDVIGVPDINLKYQENNLIRELRAARLKLDPNIKAKMLQLYQMISKTNEELITEETDLGEWNIAQMPDIGLTLSVEHVSIELKPKEAEKLLTALEDANRITVKASNKHFTFTPIHNGKEYIVTTDDDDEFIGGILLPKSSVNKLINLR